MPLNLALTPGAASAPVPLAWRGALLRVALAWAALVAVTWADWLEMIHQWWDVSTYNHVLLVPPILVWLVRMRWPELRRLAPQAWWPALPLVAGGLALWLTGSAAQINLMSQFGAVVALQAAVAAMLGPRVTAGLLFPLGYMLFLVPFGDEIIPALQVVTAKLAIGLTHLSGVPARIDGIHIDTPAGLFIVAEACSGVKFLIAMMALGTLVAHLCFASWRRRAVFMAAAAIVPVLANGVRAWGTIYVAQSQGVEFAAGFDHIVYGWIFFAVVMALLLGASWRFFDRPPEAPLVDATALEASPLLGRLERFSIGGSTAPVALVLLAAAAGWMDRAAALP